ncbi:MAG TPA: photosynthetic reaction center cytochrome c subunit family protein [Gemmatimonadaceae bacterium]
MKRSQMLVLSVAAMAAVGTSASAQDSTAHERTAGEVYHNVQVLKDTPLSEWLPTMQLISGSLGASCDLCHVPGKFASDARRTKQTARRMIRMVLAINRDNFDGHTVVTCNTCHRGSLRPQGLPGLFSKTPDELAEYEREVAAIPDSTRPETMQRREREPRTAPAGLPSADAIFASYTRAVGADKLTSLHIAGTGKDPRRTLPTFDVQFVFPDKLVMKGAGRRGPQEQIVNGSQGWIVDSTGRHAMTPAQVAMAIRSARSYRPVKFIDEAHDARVRGVEIAEGHACYVVQWQAAPDVLRMAYFDTATALLYKVRDLSQTPLGRVTSEQRFEDYRNVGGVQLPFAIVSLYPQDELDFTVTQATPNADVDARLFTPAGGGQ